MGWNNGGYNMIPDCNECHNTYVKQLESEVLKYKAFEQQVEKLVSEAEKV